MKSRTLLQGVALPGALTLTACSTGSAVDLDGGDRAQSDAVLCRSHRRGARPARSPQDHARTSPFEVLENVFDTLVAPDENLEMQPALAESLGP